MQRNAVNRHVGTTVMNERSSRSHTVFRLVSYPPPLPQLQPNMPVPLTPSTDQLRQWNEKLKQQLQQQQAEEEALAVTDMDLPTAHRRVQQLQQNLAITRMRQQL